MPSWTNDLSIKLARGLLGEDGKPCAATEYIDEADKESLREALAYAEAVRKAQPADFGPAATRSPSAAVPAPTSDAAAALPASVGTTLSAAPAPAAAPSQASQK